jgi:hypothetical protein
MRFATADLGATLRAELDSASVASVAVAYFNPEYTILSALAAVPSLKLVISDDFQVNDPYKLESLNRGSALRVVPADEGSGKLHSKVFLIRRQDGTRWAMVGSANLTRPGLFSNQEACIIFDSMQSGDDPHLDDIEEWLSLVAKVSREIDFDKAKRIFDGRARYRLQRPESATAPSETIADSNHYWALKTTEGGSGPSHWQDFLAEDVIAIGWPDIRLDPSAVSRSALEAALDRAYPQEDAVRAAKKILWFVDMDIRDLVLVCRGYAPRQTTDVHIHGVARVEGPFRYEAESPWWLFKRKASIQVIDQRLPLEVIVRALEKGSLMETIHKLKPEEFGAFAEVIRDNLGMTINI